MSNHNRLLTLLTITCNNIVIIIINNNVVSGRVVRGTRESILLKYNKIITELKSKTERIDKNRKNGKIPTPYYTYPRRTKRRVEKTSQQTINFCKWSLIEIFVRNGMHDDACAYSIQYYNVYEKRLRISSNLII